MLRKSKMLFKEEGHPEIKSDVLGSYTGVPEDPHDEPTQDADDL